MRLLANLTDARGTMAGKILSVFMTFVLAFSMSSVLVYADAYADEGVAAALLPEGALDGVTDEQGAPEAQSDEDAGEVVIVEDDTDPTVEGPSSSDGYDYVAGYSVGIGELRQIKGHEGTNHNWERDPNFYTLVGDTDTDTVVIRGFDTWGDPSRTCQLTHSFTTEDGQYDVEYFKITVVQHTDATAANGRLFVKLAVETEENSTPQDYLLGYVTPEGFSVSQSYDEEDPGLPVYTIENPTEDALKASLTSLVRYTPTATMAVDWDQVEWNTTDGKVEVTKADADGESAIPQYDITDRDCYVVGSLKADEPHTITVKHWLVEVETDESGYPVYDELGYEKMVRTEQTVCDDITKDLTFGQTYTVKPATLEGYKAQAIEAPIVGVMGTLDITVDLEYAALKTGTVVYHGNLPEDHEDWDVVEGSMEPQEGYVDADIPFEVAPCDFTRTGYEFEGWSVEPDGFAYYNADEHEGQYYTEIPVSEFSGRDTLNLYAIWTPATDTPFTVKVYLQNDGAYDDEHSVVLTEIPAVEGPDGTTEAQPLEGTTGELYILDEAALNAIAANFQQVGDFTFTLDSTKMSPVDGDPYGQAVISGSGKTVIEVYLKQVLHITFKQTEDADALSVTVPVDYNHNRGASAYAEMSNASINYRDGYELTGWKIEGTDTIITPDALAGYINTYNKESLTFVAQWTEKAQEIPRVDYEVRYYYMDANGDYRLQHVESFMGEVNSEITLSDEQKSPERKDADGNPIAIEGIDYAAYVYDDASTTSLVIDPSADRIMNVYFNLQPAITFSAAGYGTLEEADADGKLTTTYAPGSPISWVEPTAADENYEFVGWRAVQNELTTIYRTAEELAMLTPESPLTMEAVWNVPYEVHYVYKESADSDETTPFMDENGPVVETRYDYAGYDVTAASGEDRAFPGYVVDPERPISSILGTVPTAPEEGPLQLTIVYVPTHNVIYTVEFYVQELGAYAGAPSHTMTPEREAGTVLTDDDVLLWEDVPAGYVLDRIEYPEVQVTTPGEPIEGEEGEEPIEPAAPEYSTDIAPTLQHGDSVTVKVYYKQQFNVLFDSGDHGTFDAEEGQPVEDQITVSGDYGQRPEAPAVSADKGYEFIGWQVMGDTASAIVAPEALPELTEDAAYVARYRQNVYEYTVQFYYDQVYAPEETLTFEGTLDEEVSFTPEVKEGMELVTENHKTTISDNPAMNYIRVSYYKYHTVSYEWTGLPEGVTLYDEAGNVVTPALPEAQQVRFASGYATGSINPSVVYTYDEKGRQDYQYTLGPWTNSNNGAGTMGAEDIVLSAQWNEARVPRPTFAVSFDWTNVPAGPFYDADGQPVDFPELPEALTGLSEGEDYNDMLPAVDGYELYTHDDYGNADKKYTLGAWDVPDDGIIGEQNITISAEWQAEDVAIPTWKVTYEWKTPLPININLASMQLPDAETYINGQDLTPQQATYADIYAHDDYDNVNGVYRFTGWEPAEGKVTRNMVVAGGWSYEPIEVPTYQVAYSLGNDLPAQYFDAEGNEISSIELPRTIVGLVRGQSYTLSDALDDFVVYTQDEYGNQTGSYTFDGWSDPNDGTMGLADVTVAAQWAYEEIEVPTYTVSYEWTGAPEGDDAPALPADSEDIVKGSLFTVDTTFAPGYTVNSYDAHGNVNGVYTFEGWDRTGALTITEDTAIKGTWSYEATDVAQHNVTYTWAGLPEGVTFYDAEGAEVSLAVPDSIGGLVNNQTYAIDTAAPGTVVYTHDQYGNQDAKYTLGAWDDPNNGTMGNTDVEVSATWTKDELTVPTYKVVYQWAGDNVPTDVTLPTDDTDYVLGEAPTLSDEFALNDQRTAEDAYGNVTDIWTFAGWTMGAVVDGERVITGTWNYSALEPATWTITYNWSSVHPALDAPAPVEYTNNADYEAPATPGDVESTDAYGNVNGVYHFTGWTGAPEAKVTAGAVVTGEWEFTAQDVPGYTVEFQYTGDKPSNAVEPAAQDVVANQPFTPAVPTLAGWTFSGWTVNTSGIAMNDGVLQLTEAQLPADGKVVLTGSWTPDASALRLVSADDPDESIIEVEYDGRWHRLTVDGMLPSDNVDYVYTTADDPTERPFGNAVQNVTNGTWTVKATVTRGGQQIATLYTTVHVSPRVVTIRVNDASKVLGQADPVFSGTIEGLIGANDLGNVRYYRTDLTDGIADFGPIITADYDENPNYIVDVVPGNFTILEAPYVPVTPTVIPPAPAAAVLPVADAVPAAPAADGADDAAADDVVTDNENPLADAEADDADDTDEQAIDDDENPLASASNSLDKGMDLGGTLLMFGLGVLAIGGLACLIVVLALRRRTEAVPAGARRSAGHIAGAAGRRRDDDR